MRLRFFHRLGFALWLGLVALTASGIAQNQLSLNVITATLNDHHHPPGHGHHGHDHQAPEHQGGGHYMPDGTFMAGPMAHGAHGHDHAADAAQNGGHTHKGHADCSMCGLVATMAALTVPLLIGFMTPESFATPLSWTFEGSVFAKATYAPYASRAPPHANG